MLQSAFNAGIRPAWFADEVYSGRCLSLLWRRAHQALARYHYRKRAQAPFRSFLSLTSFCNTTGLPAYQPTKHLLLSA